MFDYGLEALAMAVFLMLVARPLAVLIGLAPFRYQRNELAYVSWVGLRGAVPVVLAIVPVVMGVPDSQLLFNVAFAVVLLSLLVQGATVPVAARLLKVEVPPRDEPRDKREVWVGDEAAVDCWNIGSVAGSRAEGRHPDDVGSGFSRGSMCVAWRWCATDGLYRLTVDSRMDPGDSVWFVAPDEIAENIARMLRRHRGELTANAELLRRVRGRSRSLAGDLADAYGLTHRRIGARWSVGALLLARLGRAAVVGDRVEIGAFVLTVREMSVKGVITAAGLKCPPHV